MPLIKRQVKGSKLTISEMDGNLDYLQSLGVPLNIATNLTETVVGKALSASKGKLLNDIIIFSTGYNLLDYDIQYGLSFSGGDIVYIQVDTNKTILLSDPNGIIHKSTDGILDFTYDGLNVDPIKLAIEKGISIFNCYSSNFSGDFIIPNSITTIDTNTFYNCSNLTSVNIPNSVTTIGSSAFINCKSLTSINIPNSVTTIGESAFNNCTSLISIIIPNSVTTIGNYVFYNCNKLTSIIIPNSVTTIGVGTFQECSSLTGITIPDSVISIGDYAFSYCPSLTSYTFYPMIAPTLGYGVFDPNVATLNIVTDAVGYDVEPWTDTSIFETINII